MAALELFPTEQIVGVFRGFREGGLEFHADLVLPYRNEFQRIPMHGQFLLVQLETPEEAVLGRIASLSSEGKLTSSAGEEFNIRAVREHRAVPEDLREEYLRYRVNMRVLGVLRLNPSVDGSLDKTNLTFVASHRRLPHVGSPIAFAGANVLREIAGHNVVGAPLGHLALGEYVYAQGAESFQDEPWMRITDPEVLVRFPIENLVSRRSFIFARAGFGKSNLNKLLFSQLYRETPTVIKRGNRRVPVGTIIFDPDGEYFWPDDKGRPGLCDVPELLDKVVVFTSREGPSPYYGSFVAGGIKLDVRRLDPADVIGIAIDPERQDQQNVRKLRGLSQPRWQELIDLADQHNYQLPLEDVCRLLDLDPQRQEAEALAARSNVVGIVRSLHNKSSRLMDMLLNALEEGKLCVIDVSQMRGKQALIFSGLILRRIFDRNQQEFTRAQPRTIPTIAVVEEAQTVLNERAAAAEPYIAWVKEGRKYDLGAVLITQQPGSIPAEILSQGDNWFIFHLLSSGDLVRVKQANAHFSDDLLSSLLNEPIPGQGVFWSSASGKPYPTSVRVLSFEHLHPLQDPAYDRDAVETYAGQLRKKFAEELREVVRVAESVVTAPVSPGNGNGRHTAEIPLLVDAANESEMDRNDGSEVVDVLELYRLVAIRAIQEDLQMIDRLNTDGVPWGALNKIIQENLPPSVDEPGDTAFQLVPKALDGIYGGKRQGGWHTFKSPQGKTYVKAGPDPRPSRG